MWEQLYIHSFTGFLKKEKSSHLLVTTFSDFSHRFSQGSWLSLFLLYSLLLFILAMLGLCCVIQALGCTGSVVVACGLSCSIWDLRSPTRDWTWTPCIGNLESYPLDHQGSPFFSLLNQLLSQCPNSFYHLNYPLSPGEHLPIFVFLLCVREICICNELSV